MNSSNTRNVPNITKIPIPMKANIVNPGCMMKLSRTNKKTTVIITKPIRANAYFIFSL